MSIQVVHVTNKITRRKHFKNIQLFTSTALTLTVKENDVCYNKLYSLYEVKYFNNL
jgi:hypothetical protein